MCGSGGWGGFSVCLEKRAAPAKKEPSEVAASRSGAEEAHVTCIAKETIVAGPRHGFLLQWMAGGGPCACPDCMPWPGPARRAEGV